MTKMTESLFKICNTHGRGSIAYRVCRSIIVNGGSSAVLEDSFPSSDAEPVALPKFRKHARTSGFRDYKTLSEDNKDLVKTKRSVARVSDDRIRDALMDILGDHNIHLLAWGTMDVVVPGTTDVVTLPRVIRKHSMEQMWRAYCLRLRSRPVVRRW